MNSRGYVGIREIQIRGIEFPQKRGDMGRKYLDADGKQLGQFVSTMGKTGYELMKDREFSEVSDVRWSNARDGVEGP